MPALVDTTIRLLSREPLAGRMPTADLLRLAETLDAAGFAYLEVSGGGVFDSAVRRGVESPWERISALKARTKTPLAMALRGRFLVGSRPVGAEFARRFVASAAESGIDVFRLHDPLNDVSNLREAGEAIAAALEAVRAGADLVSCAVYPSALTVHRVSGEALATSLAGLGQDAGVDTDALRRASKLVDEHLGDEPVTPVAPRIAVRAAEHRLPPGLVAALDNHLRAQTAGDRLDGVLDELLRVREEVGWPPLAAPIGQILASQALLNVLSGTRYLTMIDEVRALVAGRYGSPPGSIDPTVRRAAELLADGVPEAEPIDLEWLSDEAEGLAASDEELLLLALFGDEARPLLEAIRGRHAGADSLGASGVDQARAERIREVVRIVQESGGGASTLDEGR